MPTASVADVLGALGRTAVVFVLALALLRVADQRFLARRTALDGLLVLVLGALLARAIVVDGEFWTSLAAATLLVLLHRALAWASFRWHTVGRFAKGRTRRLVHDGVVDHAQMRRHRISERDLAEDLRLEGVADPSEVREARLERSGEISVIRARGAVSPSKSAPPDERTGDVQ